MGFFDTAFWQSLVTTLLGVAGGGYVAFWVEGLKVEAKQREKQREILRLLRGALDRDQITINKIRSHLDKSENPSQRVYADHYVHALHSGGLDVFKHPKIWGQVANIPPALDHLNRRLEDLAGIAREVLTSPPKEDARKQLLRVNEAYLRDQVHLVVDFVQRFFDDLQTSLAGYRLAGKAIEDAEASRGD